MSLLKKILFNYHTWFFQWETLEQSTLILRGRGSGWRTFKQMEKEWPGVRTAEGADQCHCEAIHDYLWKVVEIKTNSQGLQESQCYSRLQEGQGGGYMEWQMKQPQLKPWKSNGEISPRNCFQTHEGQEDHEQTARICEGEIMPDHHAKKLLAQHKKEE